jgi:SMODS and SLOG-associating 2TM effector domain 1
VTHDPKVLFELYARSRHEDQLRYYRGRVSVYERALAQLGFCSAIVLVGASTAAALAGNGVANVHVWAVLAVVLPALATVLAAYGALFGFEQQAKLYTDAATALQRAKRDAPDVEHATHPDEALRGYVEQVEEILRREQAQWGQFASEQKLPTSAG